MRGLTDREREELAALDADGARVFDGPALDALEQLGRVERYDHEPDGSYRMRPTELGRLALRLPRPILDAP